MRTYVHTPPPFLPLILRSFLTISKQGMYTSLSRTVESNFDSLICKISTLEEGANGGTQLSVNY